MITAPESFALSYYIYIYIYIYNCLIIYIYNKTVENYTSEFTVHINIQFLLIMHPGDKSYKVS